MKAVFLSFTLALTACATSSANRPINVHSVRVAIDARIEGREIISMGKVTADSAVVYTESPAGRQEETWEKSANGWALRDSRSVASAP